MTEQEAIKELRVGYLGDTEEIVQAKHMAINALEKQIAKKPITYKDTNRADCPICGSTVRGIGKPYGDWCSKCGSRLDWGNEDDTRKSN